MNKGKININLILGLILTGIVIIPAITGIFWTPYSTEAMDVSLKPVSYTHLTLPTRS